MHRFPSPTSIHVATLDSYRCYASSLHDDRVYPWSAARQTPPIINVRRGTTEDPLLGLIGVFHSLRSLEFSASRSLMPSQWLMSSKPTIVSSFRSMDEEGIKDTPLCWAHTDLPRSNIIINKDFHITGIVDWEWSYVIPSRFLMPLPWITKTE
ncbi:LOW QUALITY PROTEIN: Phosphotransferase enzyme family, partial [Geosmithia morbida]